MKGPQDQKQEREEREDFQTMSSSLSQAERTFVRDIMQLLGPYIEISEGIPKHYDGLKLSIDALQQLLTSAEQNVSVDFMETVLERLLVEYANADKLKFVGQIIQEVGLAQRVQESSELFRAAAEYALTGRVRYGTLSELSSICKSISPSFLHSKKFQESLSYRVSEALDNFDELTLKKVNGLLGTLESSDTLSSDIRTSIVLEHREKAAQLLLERLLERGTTVLRHMFWLDEFLESKQAQEAMQSDLGGLLEQGEIFRATKFLAKFPVGQQVIDELSDCALSSVRTEKAKIAAGYFEALSTEELDRRHRIPINELVSTFSLTDKLLEKTQSRKAA